MERNKRYNFLNFLYIETDITPEQIPFNETPGPTANCSDWLSPIQCFNFFCCMVISS